ncbi:MAG: hypothetical protein LBI45_01595, partial [Bacteroidales bacterium]|nr:hypothetical protein [Bacteroidales bacterium]
MKKSTRFFVARQVSRAILTMLLLFSILNSFAQVVIIPQANPKVIPLQNASFSVLVTNTDATPVNGLTLVAIPPPGFVVVPPIIPINLGPSSSIMAVFQLFTDCDAEQVSPGVTYNLYESDGITLLVNVPSPPITIDEPQLIFTSPTALVADFVSNSKTYTRVWSIVQSSGDVFLNNLQVVNTCNKANIVVTKIELVSDISGANPIDITSAVLDATQTGKYVYNFNNLVFDQI